MEHFCVITVGEFSFVCLFPEHYPRSSKAAVTLKQTKNRPFFKRKGGYAACFHANLAIKNKPKIRLREKKNCFCYFSVTAA